MVQSKTVPHDDMLENAVNALNSVPRARHLSETQQPGQQLGAPVTRIRIWQQVDGERRRGRHDVPVPDDAAVERHHVISVAAR